MVKKQQQKQHLYSCVKLRTRIIFSLGLTFRVFGERLVIVELRVAEQEPKDDEGNAETDASNCEQLLDILV